MDFILTANQIVWAKLSGFPWWPAYIKRMVSKELYEIEYFGEFERNFFDPSRIRPFEEFSSRVNKKNPKLMESFKQALRVMENQSTIEKEREEYFRKKKEFENQSVVLARNTPINEMSTNYSACPPQDHHHEHNNIDMFEQLEKKNFIEGIENSNFKKSIKKIKKTNRNWKNPKSTRNYSKTRLERHKSLPTNSYLVRESMIIDRIYFDESESELKVNNASPNPSMDKSVQLINDKLSELIEFVEKDQVNEAEYDKKLSEWNSLFRDSNCLIVDMFDTNIGSNLKYLADKLQQLSQKKQMFKSSYLDTIDVFQNVQHKLISGFFGDESMDKNQLKLSIIRMPSNILFKKKILELNEKQFHNKFPQSSNFSLNECMDLENNINYQANKIVTCKDDKKENEFRLVNDEVIFKVCKKMAKLLYVELSQRRKTKADCENVANLIENRIRNSCNSSEEYRKKCYFFLKKLSGKCEKFLLALKNTSMISRDLPINDIVQTFLIKK